MGKERQRHGIRFQNYIKKTFFGDYYTAHWDIPPEMHKGVPASIKTAGWGNEVCFAEALPQFDVNCRFDLVVAFWKQKGKNRKIIKITETRISPKKWKKLWGKLKRKDLERLDTAIRRTADAEQARRKSKKILLALKSSGKVGVIRLRRKISTSKKQRRLQCAISFNDFFKFIQKEKGPLEDNKFTLWGKSIRPPLL